MESCSTRPVHQAALWSGQGLAGRIDACHDVFRYARRPGCERAGLGPGFPPLRYCFQRASTTRSPLYGTLQFPGPYPLANRLPLTGKNRCANAFRPHCGSYRPAPVDGSKVNRAAMLSPRGSHLDLGPFAIALGKSSPATVHGWIARSGYNIFVQGDAQVQRLLQVAQTLGLRAVPSTAEGLAKLDLQIAGAWSGFAAPQITGT